MLTCLDRALRIAFLPMAVGFLKLRTQFPFKIFVGQRAACGQPVRQNGLEGKFVQAGILRLP